VIANGHDRTNCGTQAPIAAITVSAIRDVRKTHDADHAGWMSTGYPLIAAGTKEHGPEDRSSGRDRPVGGTP